MQAVLDSSWIGLDEADRSVLAALSVFENGFTIQAADVVAGASLDCLERLAEASLIQRLPDSTGGTRLQMHDLVRAYAVGRLEASGLEAEAVRLRHFEYFAGLADGSVPFWNTAQPPWDHPLRLEVANIDAAMSWAMSRGDAGRALRLMEALDPFWVYSIIPDTVPRSRLTLAFVVALGHIRSRRRTGTS